MSNKDLKISKDLLHELFEYKDGVLYNKIYKSSKALKGSKAGCKQKTGYIHVYVNGVKYLAHRLIFMMHHGYLPKYVDHIDCNKINNKIENLRQATSNQNHYNKKIGSTNTSGVKGVHWNKYHKKWTAVCYKDKKCHYLGHFKDLEDAKIAVDKARNDLHKEFARHE